jgi:hypothetical protein
MSFGDFPKDRENRRPAGWAGQLLRRYPLVAAKARMVASLTKLSLALQ